MRSTVSTGMFLARAAASAGSRPSELSGATINACAPLLIMSWMSEICLLSWEFAFVVSSSLTPTLAASSLIDWVSAIRNGLASFSDWENPTTAFFRSIFSPPYCSSVQVGPLVSSCATCSPPVPGLDPASGSSDLVHEVRTRAAHTATAPTRRAGRS